MPGWANWLGEAAGLTRKQKGKLKRGTDGSKDGYRNRSGAHTNTGVWFRNPSTKSNAKRQANRMKKEQDLLQPAWRLLRNTETNIV